MAAARQWVTCPTAGAARGWSLGGGRCGLVAGAGAVEFAVAARLSEVVLEREGRSAGARGDGGGEGEWRGGGRGESFQSEGTCGLRARGHVEGEGERRGGCGRAEGLAGVMGVEGQLGAEQRLVCEIVREAFLAVPTALARNAAMSSMREGESVRGGCIGSSSSLALRDAKRVLLRVLADDASRARARAHGSSPGVLITAAPSFSSVAPAGAAGEVPHIEAGTCGGWWLGDPSRSGVFEPLACKIAQLDEFLRLLLQLLRIGGVVRVSGSLALRTGTRHQEASDSDADSADSSDDEGGG